MPKRKKNTSYLDIERLSYSKAEAARAVGVTENVISLLVKEGKLRSVKITPRNTVIPVKSLLSFLEECNKQP